ncbi:unnamed protein product [Chondrus crispus]|uniref:phosphoglucomutase (alpha-D-glucose-1,6-bisphosphate-dependent) n=1 Tax=Chondrus crispus TaxID=2769 RepID=R7Q6V0_CHOCR|nr:unnamed protein product [Chondrus crispus]CDF33764.1 unnamed protein product [Chondrus crispus]|eukprot:XP_005713583.1 unnamed protein product [Chondrus crispus]
MTIDLFPRAVGLSRVCSNLHCTSRIFFWARLSFGSVWHLDGERFRSMARGRLLFVASVHPTLKRHNKIQRCSAQLSCRGFFSGQPVRSTVKTAKKWEISAMCSMQPAMASESSLKILKYGTNPIDGQTTGTSGMRKRAKVLVSNPKFLPNWIQSLFNALGGRDVLEGTTLIVGGDGRFYNTVAAQTIIRMAAAHGVKHLVIGRNAILTTPAVSAMIPARKAVGGIILTASHNPAGPDGDWGIKYNTGAGAPASEGLTDKIYQETVGINEYFLADLGIDINLSIEGTTSFADGAFTVEVVDPVAEYCDLLESIFDFNDIKKLLARSDFSLVFDAMHASTGEYARVILHEKLGAPLSNLLNEIPLQDFGGGHPDPNLTYAAELVRMLDPRQTPDAPQFGAASDGDGDRNMILGRGVFVSPGDSVAIIADYAARAIPYFRGKQLKGLARSMPTSSALDRVAEALGIPVYETPTGWKYFTNLMDADRVSICGEESFGTSSEHIREKDGLWAVLSWLSILAYENRDSPIGSLVTVEDILVGHWRRYGRTYNMRYDFEGVSKEAGDHMMNWLREMVDGVAPKHPEIAEIDEFQYKDPIDGTVASQQGIRVTTKDGGRVVFRLSGTGSAGATIRVYFEQYQKPSSSFTVKDPKDVFRNLVKKAMGFAKIPEITGRTEPTVLT